MNEAVITGQLIPGQELVSDDGREWIVNENGELILILKGDGPRGKSD
ncbi:MAG: hypothetical protein PHU03_08030 [Syntrophales bacterium]|jgi:hypothetical protein|nr:hypothetical protein [Syntrophales bacterium]